MLSNKSKIAKPLCYRNQKSKLSAQKQNDRSFNQLRKHTISQFKTMPENQSAGLIYPITQGQFYRTDHQQLVNQYKSEGQEDNQEILTFANVKQLKKRNQSNLEQTNAKNYIPLTKFNQQITILTDRQKSIQQTLSKNTKIKKNICSPKNDDLNCDQLIELRPVQKKSLIPVKDRPTTSKFDFTKPKIKRNHLQQLKDFDISQPIINATAYEQSLAVFIKIQEQYMVNPNFIELTQKHLNWWNRAVLVDWMRHISYEFGLQRDTYHIAVVLLDNFMVKSSNISKSIFQSVGVTTLFIASKLEQFQCRQSRLFVEATNNSCSVNDIHQLQIKIAKALNFKLNPPTYHTLANKIMYQWDSFVLSNNKSLVNFKQLDEQSYRMYRSIMQYIDCAILDPQTFTHKPKVLVCSFLYLIVGLQMRLFSYSQVVDEFPRSSRYLLMDYHQYNQIFRSFVEFSFGFSLFQILPTVQYVSTYFDLPLTFEKPFLNDEMDTEQMTLQQYCSFQTFNNNMLRIVRNRFRGIY